MKGTHQMSNTLEDDITASSAEVFSSEGSSVTLSCKYSGTAYSLQWYRQDPGSAPQFLLLIYESTSTVVNAEPPHPRLTVKLNKRKNQVDLQISSAALADTALYYCLDDFVEVNSQTERTSVGSMNSIKPENTEERVAEGGNINLTCKYEGSIYNIQWYRQYQRSRPEFLLYITEDGSIHPTVSDFSAHINKTEKRVDLQISSAAVTDSALYYCAVSPTVTGNPQSLYKNLTAPQ
ncbi:uncharacterized protein LOC121908835 [Thunnus maccoyii]|uniref:uncharacterized protein LOC121908835 n=1 Tax=Thunnus maccoyii TaxID=8240 RepID=UPI001C4D20CF|nr:uncharacterized protein LOC121908835 [Thunnus maccoyii]